MSLRKCSDELEYPIDCPIKKMMRTVFNEPEKFDILDFDITEPIPVVSPGGTFTGYCRMTVEIELTSDLIFNDKKKLTVN